MTLITQCINTNAFNISKSNVEVYHNYKKKKYSKCKCKKCVKHIKDKSMCIMHLCKSNFLSSSLAVATSAEEAWNELKSYIPNYIYGHFIISLTLQGILRSMFAQLIRIKMSPNCQTISLYFRYNFIPNPYCRYETDFLVKGKLPNTKGVSNNTDDLNNPYPNYCIDNNNFANLSNNTTYSNVKCYCDKWYVYTPNFSNLPIYNCTTGCT